MIKSANTAIDGTYYWNTFLNANSVTELKTTGEILYYTNALNDMEGLNMATKHIRTDLLDIFLHVNEAGKFQSQEVLNE